MAAVTLELALKDWFKKYHISKMDSARRAQWNALRGKPEDSDTITPETLSSYINYVTEIGGEYDVTADGGNMVAAQQLFGNTPVTAGTEQVFVLNTQQDIVAYHAYAIAVKETPGLLRIGDEKKVKITGGNLDAVRDLFQNPNIQSGDKLKFSTYDEPTLARYRNFAAATNALVGDKIFFRDKRAPVQKGWGDKNGNLYSAADVPDLNKELSPEQWEEFYSYVRSVLRKMGTKEAKAKMSAADPENGTVALDRFFGPSAYKAFSPSELPDKIKKEIWSFVDAVNKDSSLKAAFTTKSEYGSAAFESVSAFESFVLKVQNGTFDSDDDAKAKLRQMIRTLRQWVSYSGSRMYDDMLPVKKSSVEAIMGILAPGAADQKNDAKDKLDYFIAEMDAADEEIDPIQLAQFKNAGVYKDFLKALYATDKEGKKSPFNGQFASYGGSELTGWMNESVTGAQDYEKGPSALIRKEDDTKNHWETIKSNWGDFRDEHFKRFWDRAAAHIYLEPNAEGAVAAIRKEKINPIDGIAKVIEKKDAIKKRISKKSPASAKGFDFLVEALTDISENGDLEKALAGATRNGKKAAAIAMAIIQRANEHDPQKTAEARVALEILAVMQYNAFDSKHYSAVFKEKFDPFKDASFMKNKGVASVFNIATTALNYGMKGAYKISAALRNKYQRSRSKINEYPPEFLSKTKISLQERNLDFKTAEEAKEKMETLKAELEKSNKAVEFRNQRDELQEQTDEIARKLAIAAQLRKYKKRAKDIQGQIEEVQRDNTVALAALDFRIQEENKKKEELVKKLDQIKRKVDALQEKYAEEYENDEPDESVLAKIEKDINQAVEEYNLIVANVNDLDSEIEKLDASRGDIGRKKSRSEINKKTISEMSPEQRQAFDEANAHDRDNILRGIHAEQQQNMGPVSLRNKFGLGGLTAENRRVNEFVDENADGHLTPKQMDALQTQYNLNRIKLGTMNAELLDKQVELDAHDDIEVEYRIAESEYKRLNLAKEKGLQKDVPNKPYEAAKAPESNMYYLINFWNAVNGFVPGIRVNDYSLNNIKDVRKKNQPMQNNNFNQWYKDWASTHMH